MSMPFYVSPEQVMQDKAEYARKGIGRGKPSVTLEYQGGILLMAENPSSLSKIGEIYDRIAFAGVGKFSEFDQLRKLGVRFADVRGYQYSREDVRGQALANAYSQAIARYLNGEFGGVSDVAAEFAALLYAGDRLAAREELLQAMKSNDLVICDRYVPSNLAHQAAKLSAERRGPL